MFPGRIGSHGESFVHYLIRCREFWFPPKWSLPIRQLQFVELEAWGRESLFGALQIADAYSTVLCRLPYPTSWVSGVWRLASASPSASRHPIDCLTVRSRTYVENAVASHTYDLLATRLDYIFIVDTSRMTAPATLMNNACQQNVISKEHIVIAHDSCWVANSLSTPTLMVTSWLTYAARADRQSLVPIRRDIIIRTLHLRRQDATIPIWIHNAAFDGLSRQESD